MRLVPTILCGGAGSRLWPVSRELHPKPFIRLGDGQSLLQKAFLRGSTLPGVDELMTVTNRELLFKTRDEYQEVDRGGTALRFILEPFGRGTAAAVACAALAIAERHGRDALMLVLPADHLIADAPAFGAAVAQAAKLAASGRLVTFGIRPQSPETGFGYIEARGEEVVRFVEKPTRETAEAYVASGRFLWNSGMFCFGAGVVLEEMARHCPEVLDAVRRCMAASRALEGEGRWQLELDGATFAQVPDISIDYALMEKSRAASVVPCEIGWQDIGSWNAVAEMTAPDDRANRIEGEVVLHEVSGCYIRTEDRVVGAVGVEDLLIIDTHDALLVADRSRAQEVRHLYEQLKKAGHETYKLHHTVHRPWGTYTLLETAPGFKIKHIDVKPGAALSLQMHRHRSEHWVVVRGTARIVNGEREMLLHTNESTYIPAGTRHRLENPTKEPLSIVEVQCGSYVGEDDIVRFDDRYGRAPAAEPAAHSPPPVASESAGPRPR